MASRRSTGISNRRSDIVQLHCHHDDDYSVSSNYKYQSTNDLGIWTGATLLTADCLGTGILALPNAIHVLGMKFGLFFLIFNLIINLYAGILLDYSANHIEQKQQYENQEYLDQLASPISITNNMDNEDDKNRENDIEGYHQEQPNSLHNHERRQILLQAQNYSTVSDTTTTITDVNDDDDGSNDGRRSQHHHHLLHHDTATFDFIGISSVLFGHTSDNNIKNDDPTQSNNRNHNNITTKLVMILFYTNIFLVLGNYILVMSHSVIAIFDSNKYELCIPTAGIIASTLMFIISVTYGRTMANLGRSVSILSLIALGIVVIQCLHYGNQDFNHQNDTITMMSTLEATVTTTTTTTTSSIIDSLSAMGSIGFATGSQKLFLNIRHEYTNRNLSTRSLAIALFVFGTCYILVVVLAGPSTFFRFACGELSFRGIDNVSRRSFCLMLPRLVLLDPPGFLFDIIPQGMIQRRIAGLFLWIHVAISYAINSQAIVASIDRIFCYNRLQRFFESIFKWSEDYQRWMIITGIVAMSAFFVANAIPFFQDIVSIIGSLTSVPMSLLLPAIFYRQVQFGTSSQNVLWPTMAMTKDSIASYSLLVFATLFMTAGVIASIDSIFNDWNQHQGGFFSCQ